MDRPYLEQELRGFFGPEPAGITAVYLYGSVARDQARTAVEHHLGDLDAFIAAIRRRLEAPA